MLFLFFLKSPNTKHRLQVLMAQTETIFVFSGGEAGHDLLSQNYPWVCNSIVHAG